MAPTERAKQRSNVQKSNLKNAVFSVLVISICHYHLSWKWTGHHLVLLEPERRASHDSMCLVRIDIYIYMHQILNDAEVYASTWLLSKDHQPLRLYRKPSVYALTATPWKKHIPELTSAAIFLKRECGMPQAIAAAHPIALQSCHVALLRPASSQTLHSTWHPKNTCIYI